MIPSEEGCTPPFPGCDQLPPPQCGIWGDSVALNWAIIGIAPFLVWAVYNFRKRRTASALIFISGLGIIIFVMSREGKSQEAPTEAVYYYHNDHLGTPKVITDQNGTIQWEAVMEPFGEIDTFIASNVNNPFRFPGQYEDDLTGLYYNHHRYYMPDIGRYNRRDPLSRVLNNSYAYVNNNSIIYKDINGLDFLLPVQECRHNLYFVLELPILGHWWEIIPILLDFKLWVPMDYWCASEWIYSKNCESGCITFGPWIYGPPEERVISGGFTSCYIEIMQCKERSYEVSKTCCNCDIERTTEPFCIAQQLL